MIHSGKPEYSFSDSEIRTLARLMRKVDPKSSLGLDAFRCFLESYVYQIMTIEEAEVFFDEK
ncbi:MAG TPA: hypothetical protein PKO22_13295 [Treponemataceae bacterium]|nr:hypothetical protein [Treponemataceae bacterium]